MMADSSPNLGKESAIIQLYNMLTLPLYIKIDLINQCFAHNLADPKAKQQSIDLDFILLESLAFGDLGAKIILRLVFFIIKLWGAKVSIF